MDRPQAIVSYAFDIIPSIDKLNSQFWSTLIGAVVGAFVGGVITLCLQSAQLRASRKQAAVANEKQDLARLTSMLLKAAKMFSNISHIDTHLRAAGEHARQKGGNEENPPWGIVQPMVGRTPEVAFSDDERMLAVTDMPKDFIAVIEMPDIHNSLVDLLNEYSQQRVELGGLMPVVSSEGMFATTELTAQEHEKLKPRMLNLQSLIGPMIKQSAKAWDDAVKVFDLIIADGKRRFGNGFPNLELEMRRSKREL